MLCMYVYIICIELKEAERNQKTEILRYLNSIIKRKFKLKLFHDKIQKTKNKLHVICNFVALHMEMLVIIMHKKRERERSFQF